MCVSDQRPAFGSCRQNHCVCVFLTGDLLSGLVGRISVVYVCVFLTGNLLSGLVGRIKCCVCF